MIPSHYRSKKEVLEKLIPAGSVVLDVGFVGQGVTEEDPNSAHQIIKRRAKKTYGFDLHIPAQYRGNSQYQEASAEDFSFPVHFDVIFAGDLIEHLSNPGLFLQRCKRHLKPDGRLILTTPNAFSLENLAGKLARTEPTVNPDHTAYFNFKVLKVLLAKNDMQIISIGYLDDTHAYTYRRSIKKRALDVVEKLLRRLTLKFMGGIVVVAS